MYELIACIPVLVTTMALVCRRRKRIQKFLANPVLEGVPLPSPSHEDWEWFINHGHFDCSDLLGAKLGPFEVHEDGDIFVDGQNLGKYKPYTKAVIVTAADLYNQRRLEEMQRKALKHWESNA